MKHALWWLSLSSTLSCGAPAPADTDTDTDTVRPWSTLDRDERITFMTDTVVPAAQALYDEAYPDTYTVACTTCHGEEPEWIHYEMPHDGNRPLYLGDFPWPESFADADQEAYALFKRDQLVVGLAPLFGEAVVDYDDPTGPGFGCFACHPPSETPPPDRE